MLSGNQQVQETVGFDKTTFLPPFGVDLCQRCLDTLERLIKSYLSEVLPKELPK